MSWLRPETPKELRLAARRFNEHVKLASSSLTTIGLAFIGGGVIIPATTNEYDRLSPFWVMMGLLFVLAGQSVLAWMKSEE